MKTIYQSEDGTVFETALECKLHDVNFCSVDVDTIIKGLKFAKIICSMYVDCCDCPFWDSEKDCMFYNAPKDWEDIIGVPQSWKDIVSKHEHKRGGDSR